MIDWISAILIRHGRRESIVMRKAFKRVVISMLAAVFVIVSISGAAYAEEADGGVKDGAKAKRTILLYLCGSDLETEGGLASFNLRQILSANFSSDEDIRLIIMTGGADKWHMDKESELVFPDDVYVPKDAQCLMDKEHPLDPDDPESYSDDPRSGISNTYNQIWEARGADAVLENGDPDPNAGKMMLLDGDGVLGDGESAKRSIIDASGYVTEEDGYRRFDYTKEDNYEWMLDPEVLKAFINYGVENYPAEKYDLILWDHGGGIDAGFCSDLHEPAHGWDMMQPDGIVEALSDNKVVDSDGDGEQDGTFDLVNFDACLMGSAELAILFSDLTDFYIASPENVPGYGEEYSGWLNEVGKDPEIDTYKLGKKLVDDFIAFYDKEEGEGASQDGTLAVIDMKKLMSKTVKTDGSTEPRGFLDALSELEQFLRNELVYEQLYYDEFRSFRDSISYGGLSYYDLGNLISQISYVFDEADYEDLVDGGIKDTNSYTDTAKVLMGILGDPEVIYARGTKDIHTKDQFYRGADGYMNFGKQGTSGLSLCFSPKDVPLELGTHQYFLEFLFQKFGADDPKLSLLREYGMTMARYGLVYRSGAAVTKMVADGVDKNEINYDKVKEYWSTNADEYGSNDWSENILPYMEYLDGGEPEAREWLDKVIMLQRDEAVDKSKIQVEKISTESGTARKITLNDVKKQAIDGISMDIIAELPAVKDFMADPANEQYIEYNLGNMKPDMKIGTIRGRELIDADVDKDGYEKAIDWLFDPKSEWLLDPPSGKWYALKTADGKLIAAAPDVYEKQLEFPAGYFTTEMRDNGYGEMEPQDICNVVYFIFEKDGEGGLKLTELYFLQENGSARGIPASEYTGELDLFPLVSVTDGWSTAYVPASKTSFRLSKDTIDKISLEYVPISDIKDIKDTDGDGKAVHSIVTVNNIYGFHLDITDLVEAEDEKATKKSNTLSVKGKTAKVKYAKLKKKAQTLKVSKTISFVKKGQGSRTYRISTAKKGGKSFKKYFKINKKTGAVTVKKGLKKGTYKLKVQVKAAGNTTYKASSYKTANVTIKVK